MKKKPLALVLVIRQWWDRTNGGTYSKGEATLIYRDGTTKEHPIVYQWGDAECVAPYALRELQAARLLPASDASGMPRRYCEDNGVTLIRAYSYVPTKKEL